ncbi:MAG: hypothetical protein KGL39_03695 [Patescibacteria group bacterium]|nr:hypothetical protein [Patescibacteria group bacterium]
MTTLAQVRNELLPGLRGVEGQYDMIPSQWQKYLEQGSSEMAQERTSEMRFTGLAAIKQDGGPTTFDNASGDRYVYNQAHIEIALGYYITRQAIEDNLYKAQFNPANLGLQESFQQTKEIICANLLNTATTYNSAVVGDNVAMCATNHPVDGGTWSNTFSTQLDLNESSLESALIQIRTSFVNQANLKIFARGRKLLVPPQLEYVTARLWHTELRPGTANNDTNAIRVTGSLNEGYEVLDFLTSQYAWFVLTNKRGGLYLQRMPFETDMQVDFSTDNLLVKARERYSASYYNPRWLFGSFPTS